MSNYCVATLDAGRARLMTLERDPDPEEGGLFLEEKLQFIHPEERVGEENLFRDSHPHGNRAVAGGPLHRYDDHRRDHEEELRRRFCRRIVEAVDDLQRRTAFGHLVVVAPPSMLGLLRPELEKLRDIQVETVNKDLSTLPPATLYQQLSGLGVLPPVRASS